jgi:TolB-like protein/DNA-binding winged helix-turn-helix (wHTH) protein/tetratricopeptide (TPR) repeat protein
MVTPPTPSASLREDSQPKITVPAVHTYRFGVFEVNLRTRELRKDGAKIKLQDKPLQLLLLLLDHAGEIVSRDEVRAALWPAGMFVDFDANSKTILMKLRQALGDLAENPIFVETIPRHGYRFIAPVIRVDSSHDMPTQSLGEPTPSPPASGLPTATSRFSWRQSLAFGVLACVIVVFVLVLHSRRASVRPSTPRRIVLLVLPFDNLSTDASQEFFSDGLTDEMITLLGQQSQNHLAVIARTSAMQYKATRKPLAQIVHEIGGADYVLEGSVRRSGNTVAVNAQLFRVQDQVVLWSKSFEDQVVDLLSIQQDIAKQIEHSLVIKLIPPTSYTSAASPSGPAHDAYLMGLYETNKRTNESLQRSIRYFQQAIALDDRYAPAYAGLANSYLLSAGWLNLKPSDAYPKARAAALHALELDENLAEAHSMLAETENEYYWKWAEADIEFRRAIELNPNSALSHKSYAEFLMHAGRNQEAISEIEHARDLDPLSLIVNSLVGLVYLNAGQPNRAVEQCEKVVQLDPQFAPGHYFLGEALLRLQRYDNSIIQFRAAQDLSGGNTMMRAGLAVGYATAGRRHDAEQALSELERDAGHVYVSSYGLARVYSALGEKERAVHALEHARDDHSFQLMFLRTDPSFDALHGDPRFLKLVKQIGFPQ